MSLLNIAAPDDEARWTRICARGEQTVGFLQGQLSNDVLALAPGATSEGLLLDPAGDVVTSLECRRTDGDVDMIVRSEVGEQSLARLRRFLMRTRCELTSEGDTPGPYATILEQVELGEPGPSEFARHLAAHSFGARYVARHVSFTKGCFTGQELVGRLDVRGGNVPFRLARVTGDDLDLMQEVVASAGPSGERARQGLTTVVAGARLRALALVHRSLLGDQSEGEIRGVHLSLLHEATTPDR